MESARRGGRPQGEGQQGSRTAFGGDIYITNGSHGCVNTPLDAMKKIYDVVSYGFPVIVY